MNGVTYNEAWGISPNQRARMIDFILDMKKKESDAISGKQQM